MKKGFWKIGTLALCFVLCLCCVFPTFAENTTTEWESLNTFQNSGSITVTTTADEAANGNNTQTMTAAAYQFIHVSTKTIEGTDPAEIQPAQPLYIWNNSVAAWLKTNPNETFRSYLEDENVVSQAYLNLEDDSTEMKNFVGALAAAMKTSAVSLTENIAELHQSGETRTGTINGLNAGSYMVLIGGGELIYRASIANLTPEWKEKGKDGFTGETGWYIPKNQDLAIKKTSVSIQKNVNDPSAAIGDSVEFTVTASVPQYPENAVNKAFIIKDFLSKGLTFTSGTVKVYGVVSGSEDSLPTQNYTFDYAANLTGEYSGKFEIDLTYDSVKQYEQIKIVYNATVNEHAVVETGNDNEATLSYSTYPYTSDTQTEIQTKAKVYTYGLDLTKIDQKEQTTTLPGAVFTIAKLTADGTVETPITFVSEEDGTYRVAKTDDPTNIKTNEVTTGAGGKLNLRGLDTGRYQIKEVKAPAGYILLKNTVAFQITDDVKVDGSNGADGIPEKGGTNISDKTIPTGYIALKVENRKGFDLPLTGGMGTILFAAGGIVLVIAAIALLLIANRKKSADKNTSTKPE